MNRFTILTGFLNSQVSQSISSYLINFPGIDIRIIKDRDIGAGTGSAVINAAKYLDERFLIVNGDSVLSDTVVTKTNFEHACNALELNKVACCMYLGKPAWGDNSNVVLGSSSSVYGYKKERSDVSSNTLFDYGACLWNRDLLLNLDAKNYKDIGDIYSLAISMGKCIYIEVGGIYYDIGTYKGLSSYIESLVVDKIQ